MSKSKAGKRTVRKSAASAVAAAKKIHVSLGDLIAAAFDTVGNEVVDVARLFSNTELQARNGKRVVLGH